MIQRFLAVLICLLLLSSCSTKHYRRSADKEVAKIIAQKTPRVPNMDTNFTIEMESEMVITNLTVYTNTDEAFGAESDLEKGAGILSLNRALEMAVVYGRDYQTRKETVYRSALALTEARHLFTPIFSAGVTAEDQYRVTKTKQGVNKIVETDHSFEVLPSAGADVLLRTGGRIAIDFTTDFFQFFTGSSPSITSSRLAGSLTQPLLRGAGYKVAMEQLTQAERNTLYELRNFTKYRKEYVVDVASKYYVVLQNRDTVRNNWRGYQSFKQNVARERAFFDEGLRSQASLDQLKQAELDWESKWIGAVRDYRKNMDQFKVLIGLRAESRIVLDEKQFDGMKIEHPSVSIDDAVQVAMVSRLDLDTTRDRLTDAERKVNVAKNSLLPQVDLVADAGATRTSLVPRTDTYAWRAGIRADLPLDRKLQRNDYRLRLIDVEAAKRNLTTAEETIKTQIADDWRNLDEAKRNYEIREYGVQIATRRVEEQELRQELGRGTSRDLVDAQNDLTASKNQRTAALVTHTIARLKLYQDMGVLWVKPNGQWDENPNEKHETKNP